MCESTLTAPAIPTTLSFSLTVFISHLISLEMTQPLFKEIGCSNICINWRPLPDLKETMPMPGKNT